MIPNIIFEKNEIQTWDLTRADGKCILSIMYAAHHQLTTKEASVN